MFTFRTTTEVPDDRQVIVHLPLEAPTGQAEVVVTVGHPENSESPNRGNFRRCFGTINSGNPNAADNESIDADLAREYGGSLD
jgi:hypothetical protein